MAKSEYIRFNREIYRKLVDFFREGKSLNQIANITKIPYNTICYWINQGEKGRQKYISLYKNFIYFNYSIDVHRNIINSFLNHESDEEIEENNNLKKGTINFWLKNSGWGYDDFRKDYFYVNSLKDKSKHIRSDLGSFDCINECSGLNDSTIGDYSLFELFEDYANFKNLSLPKLFWLISWNFEQELKEIEIRFHKLILKRANSFVEFKYLENLQLPKLSLSLLNCPEQWFAVPGMYGGFAYSLSYENNLQLNVGSWSRVVGGSGQDHRINRFSCKLIDEGFV